MDRRALNFSNEEIGYLLSWVDEFKDVLECKKSDTVLWKDKEAAWTTISKKLVEIGFPPRTTKQLRDKWGNLKKDTKKKYGDEKVESFKTGGGPKKVIMFTPNDDKIKSIIGVAVTGDSNIFDSDKSTIDCTDPQEDTANPQEEIADCQEDKHRDKHIMTRVEELKEGSTNSLPNSNWSSWNPAALKTPKAAELSEKQELKNKDEQLPLGPSWTPKRLLFKKKMVVNEPTKIKGKFILLNPKSMANFQGNKENSKPESVIKSETVTKPIKPEIQTNHPLEDVGRPSSGMNFLNARTPSQKSPSISGMKKKTVLTTDCRIKINVLSEAKLELVQIQKDCLRKDMFIKNKEHTLKMEHEKEEHEIKMKKHKIELELLELELKTKKGSSYGDDSL